MKTFTRFTLGLLLIVGIAALVTRLNAAAQPGKAAQPDKKAPDKKSKEQLAAELDKQRRVTAITHTALTQTYRELLAAQSYEAEIEQSINVGGRIFNAKGKYVRASGLRMRLQLDINLGNPAKPSKAQLLQVSDGQILMSLQTVNGKSRLTRRNLRQIQQAVDSSKTVNRERFLTALGTGGIAELIRSLAQTMVFDNHEDRTIDSEPVAIYEGTWSPKYRTVFLRQGGKKYPDHVPDRVRIYISRANNSHLLRRVEYFKRGDDGKSKPMLMMGFKIRLNRKLEDNVFVFPKRTEFPEDVTNRYLQMVQPPPAAKPKS